MSIEALKSARTARASQDGSREFITLVASICADGDSLPPALIYQGASHDLQDTWLEDFDHVRDQAFFASSENGWSCDLIGQHWLKLFDRTTKEKAKRDRRLLIVDGHSSHVNMRFISYADANRIILVVLPPHSTHRLQPLDIGLFSPLATYYSQQIDKLLVESQGLVRITKRDFWSLFREAWTQAFTTINVRSAWEKTGIHPFNPSKVLSIFESAKSALEISPKQTKTPTSTRALRRTWKQLQKEGQVSEGAKILLHAGEKLATELEIVRHENQGLRKAVLHEKKKRKRGKAMNLYDPEESNGQALFFSPAKIERVRQRVADEEQAERQRKQAASDKKLQAAIARDEKAREAQEKKIARNLARQAAREQLAQEKAERQAVRQAQRAQKTAEAAKRKQDVAEAKAQRLQVKEAAQKREKFKKRSLDIDESERSKKRPRTQASRSRIATNSNDSIVPIDTTVVRLTSDTLSTVNSGQPSNRMRNAGGRPISLPLRSGRNTRLPARFL